MRRLTTHKRPLAAGAQPAAPATQEPTSHPEGAATQGTELAAEIREKTNGLFATPPIITDAAKEIDLENLRVIIEGSSSEESELLMIPFRKDCWLALIDAAILSRLLDAQAEEVVRLTDNYSQLTQLNGEVASRNSELRAECEQLRQDAKRLEWVMRFISGSAWRDIGVIYATRKAIFVSLAKSVGNNPTP